MFSSRLKSSDSVIDCIIIYDICNADVEPKPDYCYPPDHSGEILKILPKFILPCEHRSSLSEHYTLLFTNETAKLEFVVCLFLPLSGYIVCIKSAHPWFGLFHSLLTLINEHKLYSVCNRKELGTIVEKTSGKAGLFVIDVPASHPLSSFSSPLPDPCCHPYCQRYILEYYNALSIKNWVFVFELLLLEKSVIFSSSRLHRTTACILASLSLLYPLTWVHLIYPMLPVSCIDYLSCPTPFIAGIHSCMMESAERMLAPGVFLINLDEDKVYGVGQVDTQMPEVLRNWLITRLKENPPDFKQRSAPSASVAHIAATILVKPWLEIMTALLGGYRKAIKFYSANTSSTPENMETFLFPTASDVIGDSARPAGPTRTLSSTSVWLFDRDSFLESRGVLCQAYLRRLLDSQMVIEFIRSRMALLNSEVGIIPSDDFEDLLSRLPYAPRSNLLQIVLKGRHKLDELIKKLDRRKDKSKASAVSSKPIPGGLNITADGGSTGPICLYHQRSMETLTGGHEKEAELVDIDEAKEDRRDSELIPAVAAPRMKTLHSIQIPSTSLSRSRSTAEVGQRSDLPVSANAVREHDLISFYEWPVTERKSPTVVLPSRPQLERSGGSQDQYCIVLEIPISSVGNRTNGQTPKTTENSDLGHTRNPPISEAKETSSVTKRFPFESRLL